MRVNPYTITFIYFILQFYSVVGVEVILVIDIRYQVTFSSEAYGLGHLLGQILGFSQSCSGTVETNKKKTQSSIFEMVKIKNY